MHPMSDHPTLSPDELESLRDVGRGNTHGIPQLHWERLVSLGYAIRRLGELDLTAAGSRRLDDRSVRLGS